MSSSSTQTMVIYAVSGLVAIGILIGIGRSALTPATATACGDRDRYANSTLFRLERDGAPLTIEEILSRVGEFSTVGLRENAEIMKPRDTRFPAALQVSLRSNSGAAGRLAEKGAGVAFPWQPRSVRNATASCLSYNVFFYADLGFEDGGTLPGLDGGDRTQATKDSFAANLAWYDNGRPGVRLSVAADGEPEVVIPLEAKGFVFPRGQWVKIDQEVILNSPGQSDGVLRIWIDRALALERNDISYRSRDDVTFAGVAGNVFYGTTGAIAWAPSETTIWVSPLELSAQ
jgi:hypothetical protein